MILTFHDRHLANIPRRQRVIEKTGTLKRACVGGSGGWAATALCNAVGLQAPTFHARHLADNPRCQRLVEDDGFTEGVCEGMQAI